MSGREQCLEPALVHVNKKLTQYFHLQIIVGKSENRKETVSGLSSSYRGQSIGVDLKDTHDVTLEIIESSHQFHSILFSLLTKLRVILIFYDLWSVRLLTFSESSMQTCQFPRHNAVLSSKVSPWWCVVILQIRCRIKPLVVGCHSRHPILFSLCFHLPCSLCDCT